ncbi:MAG: hypothetical protein HYW47_05240 [Deltaproteobacteria bacterium]|nr:hypothetical protein [Deltaproteobacteria bacterium]
MESLTLSALIKIPGMQEKRADIILAGAVLLDEILKTLEIKKVYTTDYSLRDGLFVRELEKLKL